MIQSLCASRAAELLMQRDNITLLCHRRPDGDTVGSAFALYYALRQLGKEVRVLCADPLPQQYRYLYGPDYTPSRVLDWPVEYVVAVDVASAELLGELEPKILSIAATRKPVMIIGETGTGKEQIALLLYLRSTLSNRPYIVVDCAQATDKVWDFLLNHYNSPLNDNGNTIFFQNFESASEVQAWDLLASIQASDLAGRNRLLFSCTCPEGDRLPDSAEKLVQQLACLILTLPTLRSRQDEIPSLASLYLGNLNLELGKQISGFDAHAIEQLRRFPWPGNYTQFKRVIQELATVTDSYYIRNTDVAEILSRERRLAAPARQEDSKQPSLTLKQIIRQAVEQALQDNGGNQTAAARQLDIGRTTLWRYLNNEV